MESGDIQAGPADDTHASGCSLTLQGEALQLHPERAAFWERTRTLLVADAHFGKAAAFRAHGLPVPGGTTADSLDRLSTLVTRTRAERVLFLGDLLHARAGRVASTLVALEQWRERHAHVALVLVRGNHDRSAGDPPPSLGIDCVDAPLIEAPFVFAHHPTTSTLGYVLAGHIHPGIRLRGRARQRLRLPCFHFTAHTGTLPAFGAFTGLAIVEPQPDERVFAVGEGEVMEWSRYER